jgi:simple sugar transport system ATP-binding protein
MAGGPRVLVAIHPTRGLDPAAAASIRERLLDARTGGAGVLVVTSDPEEARALGGALHVVYRGSVSAPLPPDTPVETLARLMGGLAA